MKATDFSQPELLLKVFAEDGTRNTLPVVNTDTSNPQKADLTNGFPVETEGSPDDGKLPPERADFNALGYLTTSYDFFYQAGGTFTFSSTIASAIGGYPQGARLWHTNSSGVSMLLESTKDDNEDDFTDDESYIGTSWKVVSLMGIENSSIKLLDFMFRDKQVNDMSWVLSDGSWLSGSTYAGAYNHLIDDIGYRAEQSGSAPSINVSATNAGFTGNAVRRSSLDKTVGGTTYYAWNTSATHSYDKTIYLTLNVDSMTTADAINAIQGQRIYTTTDGTSFSLSINKVVVFATDTYTINGSDVDLAVMVGSDGHRVVLITDDEDATVSSIFNAIGVAWYYVLDVSNTRFKLPRTKYGIDGYRGTVGGYIKESLPNIKGQITGMELRRGGADTDADDSALYHTQSSVSYSGLSSATFSGVTGIYIDAHRHSSTYIDNGVVQERGTECYLYFYVGGFNETALVQTAGINASTINAKMDTDAGNITAQGKATVVGWGVPDYDSGVTISTPFTPTKDGIVTLRCLKGTPQMTISYSGQRIVRYQCGDGTEVSNTIWAIVHKGQEYEITTNGGTVERIFYPFIGG